MDSCEHEKWMDYAVLILKQAIVNGKQWSEWQISGCSYIATAEGGHKYPIYYGLRTLLQYKDIWLIVTFRRVEYGTNQSDVQEKEHIGFQIKVEDIFGVTGYRVLCDIKANYKDKHYSELDRLFEYQSGIAIPVDRDRREDRLSVFAELVRAK